MQPKQSSVLLYKFYLIAVSVSMQTSIQNVKPHSQNKICLQRRYYKGRLQGLN